MAANEYSYVSEKPNNFRSELGESIFRSKYALTPDETWLQRCTTVVDDVCGTRGGTSHPLMSREERKDLTHFMHMMMFIPGGRYLYYGGRGVSFFNNCFIFKGMEDTREEWGRLIHSTSDALMSGGGVGVDYSVFRAQGALLRRTGGVASGPIPLAISINEHGRNVMQGGSRRSAIYGSMHWQHDDAPKWLRVKDWGNINVPGTEITYKQAKENDFDAPAPLDFTNISLNYDNTFLDAVTGPDAGMTEAATKNGAWKNFVEQCHELPDTFVENTRMAMRNGEPGFSFNWFNKQDETGRNACTEVVSADDSDLCNLGSVNFAAIPDIPTLRRVVELATKFLVCGTIRATVPDKKTRLIRERNRRIGLGLMGLHEWMLQRGLKYEMSSDLHQWMGVWKVESERASREHSDRFYLSRPIANRAIAPTGTIGTLAGTTTGMEPIFAVAYKRRYLKGNRETGVEKRKFQYYIDVGAQAMMDRYSAAPDSIETALDLAEDPERRISFQADLQDYTDMAISSTLNLPEWGSPTNCEGKVKQMAKIIAKYAPRLRGLTMYPDGSRGGQPLVPVPYDEAKEKGVGIEFEENSEKACKSGVCGI